MLERVEAVLVADQQLQRRQHRGQADRHAQHDAAFLDMVAGDQVARAHRQHHEAGGEVGGIEHVREAIGEARIEDDGEPVGRKSDAVLELVAGRRLHPAIGRQDPERRDRGAGRHHHRRQHVEPGRHPVEAEQQHAEERRLQEERRQHLVAEQRPQHVAGDDREAAPIGAELVGQHDARHHAHRKRDREDLGPEPHQPLVALVAAAQPDRAERGDIGRQADGEARENDVKNDGEGELQTGQQDRIKIHRGLRPHAPQGATLIPTVKSLRARSRSAAAPNRSGMPGAIHSIHNAAPAGSRRPG